MASPYLRRDIVGGAPATTLTSDPGSGGTTIAIASGTGWPTGANGDFFIVIDRGNSGEEKIRCASRSGTNITVQTAGRGSDGTSAAAHAIGVAVEHVITATDADEANYTVSKTVGKATAAGQILVADAANSFAAVQGKTSGSILLGNGTTVVSQAVTGDVTINGSGVTAIGSSKVTSAMIVDGTIVTGDIATGAITSTNILDATITGTDIATGTITTGNILDGTITSADLASSVNVITTGAGAPASSPSAGAMYYDTTNNLLYVRNSTPAWVCITEQSVNVATSETRSNSAYGNLSGGATGPAVTVVTGTKALVTIGGNFNSPLGQFGYMSFVVSGATTLASSDSRAVITPSLGSDAVSMAMGRTFYLSALTAGSNVFTCQYRTSSGGQVTMADRTITVVGIP